MSTAAVSQLKNRPVIRTCPALFPRQGVENFGFRSGFNSVHTSRTMMLAELSSVLESVPSEATKADRIAAIIDDNLLGKKTFAARKTTAQKLTSLYSLDPKTTIFRVLQTLWREDPAGRPLTALLVAAARDPILRITADAVLRVGPGEIVTKEDMASAVVRETGELFENSTVGVVARNSLSTWTQSGHLEGRSVKTRRRSRATCGACAQALTLGALTGYQGVFLFRTFWALLLDAPEYELHELAHQAALRGLIVYRRIGDVVEVDVSPLLTPREREAIGD